jgi:hypothetical protein
MNQKLKTHEIGKLLNRSAAQLDQRTLDKLQSARRFALKYQQDTQHTPVLSWLTQHGLVGHHSTVGHKTFNWGLATLLVVVLLAGALYMQQSYDHDHSDIDIAILTDDLPVDMYVD